MLIFLFGKVIVLCYSNIEKRKRDINLTYHLSYFQSGFNMLSYTHPDFNLKRIKKKSKEIIIKKG